MATTLTTDAPIEIADITSAIPRPSGTAGVLTTTLAYASRTLRHFIRTPQLIVVEALTSAMFLLIFRYVFGGAIDTGPVSYADFLIAGLAAATALFGSAGAAVGVAEDLEKGMFDRLKSLPIPRIGILFGRSLADVGLVGWSIFITFVLGFATGFRFHDGVLAFLAVFGLCVLFGAFFTWMFIWMGLIAGNTQAAEGLGFAVFPFVFVSSAYVPVESMPGWLQPIAENQPVTMMVGAVRSLTIGPDAEAILGHSTGWFLVRALIWGVVIVAIFAPLAVHRFSKR